MERTHDRSSRHDAVTQRPTLVWALVVGGQKLAAEIEDGDLTIGDLHRASLAQRNRLTPRHAYPSRLVHTSTFGSRTLRLSIGWSDANCVGCVGSLPSSQASRERAFDFLKRSRRPCRTASGA